MHGTLEEIHQVASDYNIYFEKEDSGSAAGYLVGHSTLSYVIDTDGNLVLGHRSYETSAMDIVFDIKHRLTKPSSTLDATGKMMLLCESGCMFNLPGKNQ
ncbi:MAG TPA: SCO family protein [Anaerolineales bacterium]|nr:SCO family protein [Anaerolineales bacterium]